MRAQYILGNESIAQQSGMGTIGARTHICTHRMHMLYSILQYCYSKEIQREDSPLQKFKITSVCFLFCCYMATSSPFYSSHVT